MKERESFYANGMTVITTDNESLIRFMRRMPVFNNDSDITDEVIEESISIVMPPKMLKDLPDFVHALIDSNAETNREPEADK